MFMLKSKNTFIKVCILSASTRKKRIIHGDNKNYIRINITVHCSNFHILHDEKIAVIYAVITVFHFGLYIPTPAPSCN